MLSTTSARSRKIVSIARPEGVGAGLVADRTKRGSDVQRIGSAIWFVVCGVWLIAVWAAYSVASRWWRAQPQS